MNKKREGVKRREEVVRKKDEIFEKVDLRVHSETGPNSSGEWKRKVSIVERGVQKLNTLPT